MALVFALALSALGNGFFADAGLVIGASGDDGGCGSLSLSGSGRGSGSDGSGREGNRSVGAVEIIVLGARDRSVGACVRPRVGATRTFFGDVPSKHNNEHSI